MITAVHRQSSDTAFCRHTQAQARRGGSCGPDWPDKVKGPTRSNAAGHYLRSRIGSKSKTTAGVNGGCFQKRLRIFGADERT